MIKNQIKEFFSSLRKEANIVEIIFWYAVRICFICAAIIDEDPMKKFIFSMNLLGCFAYSLLRFITPKESFIWRAGFHVQTLICFTSFTGYFIGHATHIHDYISKYDFILHVLSGASMVIMGYLLTKAIDKEKSASTGITTLCSLGFSFMVIIAWEIFEFFCDYYIPGATNQAYEWSVPDDLFWFKIFGYPQAGTLQYPIIDTMIDMVLATFTAVGCAVVLYIILKKKEKVKN